MRRAVRTATLLLLVGLLAAADPAAADRHLVVGPDRDSLSPELIAAVAAAGGTVDLAIDALGLAYVSGLDDSAAALLAGDPRVWAVEAERVFHLDEIPDLAVVPAGDLAGGDPTAGTADPSGAALFPLQWELPAIGAPAAWDAGHLGSPEVTVAVLDTGVDYLHPDLEGLIDLDRSLSLLPGQDALAAQFFPDRLPITDLHFHGTAVSSAIASNAVLVAGITSRTTLFAVRVCDITGDCYEPETLAGIVYAVDAGADVINLSLGGFGGDFDKAEHPGLVAAIHRAFQYAKRAGVTVVVAAGNQAEDLDHNGSLHAAYCDEPHVICVSATGPVAGTPAGPWVDVDAPAPYTNFGRSAIDLAAPGGSTGGGIWSACTTTSLLPPVAAFCGPAPTAVPISGTSFAAPQVSGLAALLVGELGRRPAQIRARIRQGADDLGEPGHDPFYGAGRLSLPGSLEIE